MRCHDCFTTVRVRADSCSWPIGAAWPFLAWSHRDGTHCWNIYTASGELARTMAGPHSFFGSGAGGISSPQASLQIAWTSRFNDCSIRLPLLRHGLKVPQVTVVFALSAAFGLANVLTPPDISGNRHGRTCVVVSAVPVPDTNQPGHVSLCANVKRRVCGFSLDMLNASRRPPRPGEEARFQRRTWWQIYGFPGRRGQRAPFQGVTGGLRCGNRGNPDRNL